MTSFPTTTPVSITEWTRACLFSPRRCPADVSPSLNDLGTCGPNASVEELRMIDLTRALARFRAFPDDISLALEGDKPFAGDAGAPRWPRGSGARGRYGR